MRESDLPIRNKPTGKNGIESSNQGIRFGHKLRADFLFDENWTNLNHGILL
jgi:hypothetical protein